jgi:SAM-dependent methyltransferase
VSAETQSSLVALKRLVDGYRVSQAISAAVSLGVPDLLGEESRTSADLAAATGTHEPSLYRLLRALASAGVLSEDDDRRFALTELGRPLRTDDPESLAGWAEFIGRPHEWQAWSGLADSVRSGENAFASTHGVDVWTHRAQLPEEGAYFDRAMQSRLHLQTASLLDAYDFGRFRRIVDVGGGNGSLLAAILNRYDAVEGVLFDQAHVVAGAPAVLEAAGIAERCEIVAGSFFEFVPGGGDAYVMSAILHDWEDEDSRRILESVRRAIPDDGVLLVLERLVGGPNEDLETKFGDLTMFVIPGGRERTRDEFADLFFASGFRLQDAIAAGAHFVIEGDPV